MAAFEDFNGVGLPTDSTLDTVLTGLRFEALDNFTRTFAFNPEDKLVILADRKLDPRVIHAICGLARSRGIKPWVIMSDTTQHTEVPVEIRPIVEQATFVVSSWFCSIIDPFCIAQRAKGQRWVKITYFRNLDLLDTDQARFPIDIVGEIIRQTAAQYPESGDFDLHFSNAGGTDLTIEFTAEMRRNLLSSNRWRGNMAADEPGCYVHYLPTHGPNLYDRTSVDNDNSAPVALNGTVVPFWAVGFAKPFEENIKVQFTDDCVTGVDGDSEDAAILRDMLIGGQIIELGCGFNPKAPRHTVYPAGSNSPGALHYGIDLAKPSDYIRRMMPEWEEPPVHMDLISYDTTVTAGNATLIDQGFLTALRAPSVVAMAERYGDPIDLLENWPE
ncbi:MAG: hypothetical protein GKS00_09960 [Alphaproteobacteria bacterium]|nr:hypothetical protein [Alphaproteobacteria bacterium]